MKQWRKVCSFNGVSLHNIIMKKLLIILLLVLMIVGITPVSAESIGKDPSISFSPSGNVDTKAAGTSFSY